MPPAPRRAVHSSVESPAVPSDRIALLDAVRGFALGGILLANLTSFFGVDMLGADARRQQWLGAVGEDVLFAIDWLIEGKFYSIFSILLGAGFALQARRARRHGRSPRQFDAFFRRRMAVLIAIGLVHMFALWSGDILTLYGVMGLLLPLATRTRGLAYAALVVACLAVPVVTHGLVLASEGRFDPRAPFADAAMRVRQRLGVADRPAIEAFAQRAARDYWAWNASYAVGRPGTYLQSGRPAKVLALFMIGAWIGAQLLPHLAIRRRLLRWTVALGGPAGLLASFHYASVKAATGSTFLVSDTGLGETVAYALGTTPLALAYLATAALWWRTSSGRAVLEYFVPLGRMALSVYLTQTVVQLALFSGLGLGLAGRVPVALLPLVAFTILASQRQACRLWLRQHEQGPVEHLWRRAVYGRWLSPPGT